MNKSLNAILLITVAAAPAFCQTPVVSQGGVVNGASFSIDQPDKRVAPGSIISIFGTSLASGPALADTIPISTSLGDVQSVTFNGVAAPILSTGTGQINVQLPWELTPPTSGTANVPVVVTRKTGKSQPVQTPIGIYSPGIFTANASGSGHALALIAPDNAIAAPAGSIPGRATRPAKPGDVIQIYATGLGPVMNTPKTGASVPGAKSLTTTLPVVMFGGITGQVGFSGLAPGFVGLYQVNVTVPASAPTGDAVPLQIEIGGVTSTAQAVIAIAAP